jgi:antirestriction protein ArdC
MLSKQGRTDVYEQITAALIAAIEEGTGTFEMPWHTLSTPINAANQKLYRGVNSRVRRTRQRLPSCFLIENDAHQLDRCASPLSRRVISDQG